MKPAIKTTIAILASVCCGLNALNCGGGEPNSSSSETPAGLQKVEALLRRIEGERPSSVVRNKYGDVYALTVPNKYASDENLLLVSKLSDLTTLKLFIQPHAGHVTASGFAQLGALTNLDAVSLECPVVLPDGIFRAVCQLRSLRSLRLNRAAPATGEYACLTNLTRLKDLSIYGAEDFGDSELAQLSDLPVLNRVVLSETKVSDAWPIVIQRFPSLMSMEVWNAGQCLRWSRKRASEE